MSDPNQPTVVLVLGMHRSGTSLVIRLLNLLGVSLGSEEHLLPPVDGDNPTGFWEHREVAMINDTILDHLGGPGTMFLTFHIAGRPPVISPVFANEPRSSGTKNFRALPSTAGKIQGFV